MQQTKSSDGLMVKRKVNLRPLFIALIFLILGIVCYANIFLTGESVSYNFYYVLFIVAVVALVVLLAFAFLKNSDNAKNSLLVRHKSNIAIAFVFIMLGFFAMQITTSYNNVAYPDLIGVYEVVGEIEDNFYETNGVSVITLNNVVATSAEHSIKLKSRARLVVFATSMVSENEINAGNSVKLTATISKTPFNKNGYNFSSYFNNYVYDLQSVDNELTFFKTGMDLDETIRDKYKQILHENTSHDLANLGFSLLFGNDEVLSTNIKNLFTATGVVHIISVSGLHVSVLVGAVLLLLNKLKLNKKTQLAIVIVVLAFYSYLCGFSPTVIRSAVMFVILLWSSVLGEQYDALSSLSFAGLFLLILSPVWLFSLGFQLSFLSILSIITLAPIFNKFLSKARVPKSVSMSVSITLSVTILTLPLISHYFNSVAVYSVVSNLIAVPIMSFSYVAIFAITTVAILIPAIGALLVVPALLLHFSKLILMAIYQLPGSTITMLSEGYIALILLLTMALVVRFFIINKGYKVAISGVFIVLVVVSFVFSNMPAKHNYYSVMAAYQKQGDSIIITTEQNKNILVASNFVCDEVVSNLLSENGIAEINTVVLFVYNHKSVLELGEFAEKYNIANVYFYDSSNTASNHWKSHNIFVNANFYNESQNINKHGVNINAVVANEEIVALDIVAKNKNILAIKGNAVRADYVKLSYLDLNNYNIVISPLGLNLQDYDISANIIIGSTSSNQTNVQSFNLKELANFTIKL